MRFVTYDVAIEVARGTRFFAIALGSLREVDAAIELACMGGAFDEPPMAAARDRLGGLLWPQAHK